MRNLFFTFLLILAVTVGASAQSIMQDAIYLKNGNVIRGTIVEYAIGGKVKIKTLDGSILNYTIDEITKFTREQPSTGVDLTPENSVVAMASAYAPQSSQNQYSANSAPQRTSNNDAHKLFSSSINLGSSFCDVLTTFSVDYVARFNIIPQFSVGVGAGIGSTFVTEYWDQPFITVPTFVSLRSVFLESRVSPYAEIGVGGIGVFPTSDGGLSSYNFYFNPVVGVQFKTGANKSIALGLGYLSMGEGTGQCNVRVSFNF